MLPLPLPLDLGLEFPPVLSSGSPPLPWSCQRRAGRTYSTCGRTRQSPSVCLPGRAPCLPPSRIPSLGTVTPPATEGDVVSLHRPVVRPTMDQGTMPHCTSPYPPRMQISVSWPRSSAAARLSCLYPRRSPLVPAPSRPATPLYLPLFFFFLLVVSYLLLDRNLSGRSLGLR